MSGVRIVRLYAENFKKIRVVDITPVGNVVRVTGPNGSGKSSVLDSFMAALGGKKLAPAKPVREGEKEGVVEVDLGEYKVTQRFRSGDEQPSVVVTAKDGKRFSSPQKLLDKMLGDLTFDPLAFSRMKPADQLAEIKRVAGLGGEIDELDQANAVAYERRTGINRELKQARAAAEQIKVPEDLPEKRVNVAELAEQMEKATEHNAAIDKRRMGRTMHEENAAKLRTRVSVIRERQPVVIADIETRCRDRIASIEKQIRDLEREMQDVNKRADADIKASNEAAEREVSLLASQAGEIEKRLSDAGPLALPIDTLAIKEQLSNAQVVNASFDLVDRRAELLATAEKLEKSSAGVTEEMAMREERKRVLIAAAKLPIPGLGLGQGCVTLNGIPLAQASSAEQLRTSVAIAMAANPTLRILRIAEGSLLDSKSMAIIEEMAGKEDFQCWVESVDEGGTVGIVMQDGLVAGDYQDRENYDREKPREGARAPSL